MSWRTSFAPYQNSVGPQMGAEHVEQPGDEAVLEVVAVRQHTGPKHVGEARSGEDRFGDRRWLVGEIAQLASRSRRAASARKARSPSLKPIARASSTAFTISCEGWVGGDSSRPHERLRVARLVLARQRGVPGRTRPRRTAPPD